MSHLITVFPDDESWILRSSALASDVAFVSGAQAEAEARRLAGEAVRSGRPAELEIWLRDGSLAGRFHYDSRAA